MTVNKCKIEGYEVFPDGTLKLSCLLKHMQQAACDDIDALGTSYEQMRADDLVFVIIKMGIVFSDVIRKGDEIEVMTLNTDIQGIIFVREFVIRKNGICVARATTHWVLMSYSKRMPQRPARLQQRANEPDMGIESVELPRSITESEPFDAEYDHRVVYSELDENRHMNNTVYADLIYDYISRNAERSVKNCRIYYNGEARLGDILHLKVKENDEHSVISCVNTTTGKSCFDARITFGN